MRFAGLPADLSSEVGDRIVNEHGKRAKAPRRLAIANQRQQANHHVHHDHGNIGVVPAASILRRTRFCVARHLPSPLAVADPGSVCFPFTADSAEKGVVVSANPWYNPYSFNRFHSFRHSRLLLTSHIQTIQRRPGFVQQAISGGPISLVTDVLLFCRRLSLTSFGGNHLREA